MDFKKYNYIVNSKNGEFFPASDFYLYPVTANDYAELYKNYTKESYPVMAFIYLTNRCADNCNGCFARLIEDGDAELSWPIIERLLQDLSTHGTKAIKLAGREPTSSPYLGKCLELSAKLGLRSVCISSGARIDKFKNELSNYCTHLRLSLNTINQELHENIHHPNADALKFNDRIKYASEIIEQRKTNGLITGATYLVREAKDTTAYEYAKMCKKMGFNYVRYTLLDNAKGNWNESWEKTYFKLLTLEDENFKINIHNSIVGKDIDIQNLELIDPAIVSRVVIHANGKVNSCQEGWRGKWDEDNIATFGNINDNTFYDIWTGQKRFHFLNYIREGHIKGMKECGSCISGNKVCKNNCKYSGFNLLQKWIIKQLENDPESNFTPVLYEKAW